jgi:hypothetical protein
MCWLVLHCRPGLACRGKTKERAEQKQLKGINACCLPHSHHPSTAHPPSQQHQSHPSRVLSSPPISAALRLRLLGPRRSDWTGALTGGLRGLPFCTTLHNPAQPERDKGVYAVHGRPTTNIHKANLPKCHLPSLLRLPARILCSMQVHLENHTAQLAKTLLAFTGIYLHRAYTRPGGHY